MIYRTFPRLEVLLGRRSDLGLWDHLAGIVEPAEHPVTTIMREANEEFGVRVEVERMLRLSVGEEFAFPNGDRCQFLDHAFVSRWSSGCAYPADGEALEVAWFTPDALPTDTRERVSDLVELAMGPQRPVVLG